MLFDRVKRFTGGIIKHKRKAPRERKAGERLRLLIKYTTLFLSALAISIVMCAQNSGLYLKVQDKCGLFGEAFPEDRQAVIRMNESVTDFLSGKTQSIENASLRANKHMQDVKRIFDRTEDAGLVLFAFSALIMFGNKKSSLLICVLPVLSAFVLAVIFAFSDFSALFYAFHKLVFDNDLWLLSPDEDLLIRCLPEEFFFRMALIAVTGGLFIYMVFCLFTFLINKFGRRD